MEELVIDVEALQRKEIPTEMVRIPSPHFLALVLGDHCSPDWSPVAVVTPAPFEELGLTSWRGLPENEPSQYQNPSM
jgi:hypothetical protein